jgi:pimeloyl-ACP methyl ester carboxylesterase
VNATLKPPSAPTGKLRRRSTKILSGLIGLYVLICLIVFFGQRHLIYYPSARMFPLPPGFEAWKSAGSDEIQGYKRVGHSDVCLFFFHGNASNARGWAHATVDFPGDVFVLEYQGYGERPGSPSEREIKAAAKAAFAAEAPHYRTVIVCGQSLGCGVTPAILEGHSAEVGALVLITPFTSISDMAAAQFPFLPTSLLLKDRFQLFEAWRAFPGPSYVIAAGSDEVIPEKLWSKYIRAQTTRHQVVVIPNAKHNDPRPSSSFWDKAIEEARKPARPSNP